MPHTAFRFVRQPISKALRLLCCVGATSFLVACAGPTAIAVQTVYDFGPLIGGATGEAKADGPALALAGVKTPMAQDTTDMQYRLAYANAQELRPYALARWSMPPGQLVQQRLRAALALKGPVVEIGQGGAGYSLQVVLEEFSQQFDSPASSQGVVQLRATLLKGNALVGQQTFRGNTPASTADAAGGVRALALASDEAAKALASWVAQNTR